MNVERLWLGIGWALVVGCPIGWAATAFTVARDEPQFVLGLSWVALELTGCAILLEAQAQKKVLALLERILDPG